MQVTTGFGYYVKNGLKIMKYAEFPVGTHPDLPEGTTFVEVADQAALDTVTLDSIPLTPAQQKQSILAQLDDIDSKSIRALRTNDATRLSEYEAQAVSLRAQLAALN